MRTAPDSHTRGHVSAAAPAGTPPFLVEVHAGPHRLVADFSARAIGFRCALPKSREGERADGRQKVRGANVRVMAWDFSTDPEWQEQLDWVEELCREEIEPLDLVFPYAIRIPDPKIRALVDPIQQKIKDRGLWAVFLDEELGGPGYGQLKLALLNEILGRYGSAPAMFGCQAPDTGNMEMLAAYGTEEQKERWLKPLMNQQMWSAYS